MNIVFKALLYVSSFGAILGLFASATALIAFLTMKLLKGFGRLIRATAKE
jgi:hypothetical protein